MGRGTVKDDGGHTSTAHHAPGSRRIAPGEMGGSAGHGKMHLTSAIVKRFKSIDDSEVVRFEPDVTCLVGRNESGKTAFLEALARLNPLADDPLAFDELRDYPRRLRGSEEEIAATVPVSATFELDDADVDDLWGEFGPGVVTSRTVRLDRTYGGRRRLVVEQDDDGRARGGGAALASFVTARVPRFLYFGQYNVLPGRVSIPRLQTLPPTRLAPGERTARSLLRLAGVGADDFVESTYERRKVALEVAAERIGAEVLRYWSQGPDSEVRETDQLVVLLDEPGLGLHAAAQADLLRYIGERLAPRHQVVYTTHSPFMVDPTAPRRVRTVEDLDGEGTRVREPAGAVHPDTLVPLRAALASRVAAEVDLGPDTLLVSSPADLVYLEVMSAYLREAGRGGLDPRWVPLPAGGLHAIPALAAMLGAPLRAAVLLSRGAGHPEVTELVADGLLLPERLVALTEVTGTAEAGIEDLFGEGFYLELLAWSGLRAPRASELPSGGALVKRVEYALGQPIDRYQPARFLLINQERLLPAIGRVTINRFAQLFEILNELEPSRTERGTR